MYVELETIENATVVAVEEDTDPGGSEMCATITFDNGYTLIIEASIDGGSYWLKPPPDREVQP